MALQYFQSTSINSWMNIGCNDIVCNNLTGTNLIFSGIEAPLVKAGIVQGLVDNLVLRTNNGNISMTFNQSTQAINVISSGFNVFELSSSVFTSTPIVQGDTDNLVLQTNSGNINILLDESASRINLNGNVTFNASSNSVNLPVNRGISNQVITSNGSGNSIWSFPALINGNAFFTGSASSDTGANLNFIPIQPARTGTQFNNGLALTASGLQITKTGIYNCIATVEFIANTNANDYAVTVGINGVDAPGYLGMPVVSLRTFSFNYSVVLSLLLNDQLTIMLAQDEVVGQFVTVKYWSLSVYCIQ